MEDLYCKIFINSSMSIGELSQEIGNFFEIVPGKFLSIESDYFTVDILKNKEFDEEKAKDFPDGFLYFPYFLDVDSTENTKRKEYIKLVGDLTLYLWDKKCQLVVSSDFEEILPNNGGYNHPINY
ncbi:1,4-dihydroxy-6-naphthoate synthase [Listeria monocytogenes]|uniref:1,4-dihydroxy-6-naphthoate synthase n=1 Tax=Listeria monocytogenes TaxID=1639 RepID=UPI0010E2ABC4|nr:1,4-dihydroxy-6-naphthoate synthase [Listeria monocytogenes]EAD7212370.1 1,4-dihydroxy-6-naphthoate synthase [Listeria monocytogenes]EAF0970420.1 1,4-dihydroxy-6-naphthoate synthase [Listeria monocytogenes]EAK8406157.1 1,4-dihydroxy-6-naphthoate synthase [Listeria monocytogenes]EAO7443156.1 1,4-dihydroxy-6-naphthoate synthase [Listeria monocytogenes]EFP2886870.1 1,4-dihydroxy-6-naphthoate synthase [Listeria monocytogenes]